MLLTNTKITSEAYFHNRLVYKVVCSPAVATATIGDQGGSGPGCQRADLGMERGVDALTLDKQDEL